MSASIARIEPISTQAPAREEPVQAPLPTSLRPGHRITVNGVLAAARSVGRSREHTGELCFEPLSDFVRQLVDWSGNDSWTGTFRFLIVEFVIDAGPLYAQLWSEPGQAVLMEVGPGERDEENGKWQIRSKAGDHTIASHFSRFAICSFAICDFPHAAIFIGSAC